MLSARRGSSRLKARAGISRRTPQIDHAALKEAIQRETLLFSELKDEFLDELESRFGAPSRAPASTEEFGRHI